MSFPRALCCLCLLCSILWSSGCSPNPSHTDTKIRGWKHWFDSTVWSAIYHDYCFDEDGLDRPAVQAQIAWYEKRGTALTRRLQEANYTVQWIYRATQEHNLPSELALIPYIESNYDPFAHSHVGAAGLWQMMPGTASGLGLDINWWFDARRDLNLGTDSALDYLAYLYEQLGHDWLLAIAAYDSGEGTIRRAIARNKKLGKPTDFWSLKLPKETQRYIPKLLAIRAIVANPQRYHIELPNFARDNIPKTVPIDHQINIRDLANWAGMPEIEFRRLNAGFRRFATPPKEVVTLYVPPQNYATLLAQLHAHGDDDLSAHWQSQVVKAGDTLSGIAKAHHTSIEAIRIANHLKSDVIHVGDRLMIPGTINDAHRAQDQQLAKQISGDHLPGPKQIIYHVKVGDTLAKVAREHHTTINAIAYWNHLSIKASLHSGQKLVIWQRKSSPHGRTIIVKSGDYLGVLAKRYHTSVSKIRRANHLNSDNVRIGQKLWIPT